MGELRKMAKRGFLYTWSTRSGWGIDLITNIDKQRIFENPSGISQWLNSHGSCAFLPNYISKRNLERI